MKLSSLGFAICLANAVCLASVITTVSVSSDAAPAVSGKSCSNMSNGALVACDSLYQFSGGSVTGHGEGSSIATYNSLMVHAAAGSSAGGDAGANAVAQFQDLVVLSGGSGSGTVVGQYAYNLSCGSDYQSPCAAPVLNITQGSATGKTPGSAGSGTFKITSTFTFGVPFTITAGLTGSASSTSHQNASADGAVNFQGFTDPNGNAVAFAVLPEPAGLPLVAGLIAILGAAVRSRFRPRRLPADQTPR